MPQTDINFIEQFGPWIGIAVYILMKDVIPFIVNKYLPSRIKANENGKAEKREERTWAHNLEEERLIELRKIADSTQALSLSMMQTNERIATMMTNQQRILGKQDEHHNAMMDAVIDMREEVARRSAMKPSA